jgi:hypothetical protein
MEHAGHLFPIMVSLAKHGEVNSRIMKTPEIFLFIYCPILSWMHVFAAAILAMQKTHGTFVSKFSKPA